MIKLSSLISTSFDSYDGVIILTSGFWQPDPVRNMLSTELALSKENRGKLRDCLFYSPKQDAEEFGDSASSIRYQAKIFRLKKIIEKHGLQSKHFVLLDDNQSHCDGFNAAEEQFSAVRACTDTADKSFYQQAEQALVAAYVKESSADCVSAATDSSATIQTAGRFFSFVEQGRARDKAMNTEDLPVCSNHGVGAATACIPGGLS